MNLKGPARIFDLPGFHRMGGQGRMLRPNAPGLLHPARRSEHATAA